MATKIIYLKPDGKEGGNAWFAAWTWGGSTGDAFVTFTESNDPGIYKAEMPSDRTGMKVLRMAPGASTPSWTQGDNGYWNQSGDLTIPSDKNCWSWGSSWDGATGSWSNHTETPLEPEDPTATYYFKAVGTNLKGEELIFGYSAEGIDALDLDAIPSGTTLTVTISGLANVEDGYHSKLSGVDNFNLETSTFTYKVMDNTSLNITQTQVINDGLYLFGSMMMLEEGDGGWKIEALTPEWKLQETENDAEGFSQWKINIPATLVGEQVKVVYVQNGSIGSGDYKTWNQALCESSEGYVSFSEDGNLIIPDISNESTMWISDHNGLWKGYIEVLDTTDTPTLTLDLEEVSCDKTEGEIEKGSHWNCVLTPVEGSTIDESTLKVWYGSKEYTLGEYEDGKITIAKDSALNEYYVSIIGVEKHIKIQADALLATGSYLYYNLKGHRHYKKISDDKLTLNQEICFDVDLYSLDGFNEVSMIDGDEIHVKIVESSGEPNGRKWYNPNKTFNEEHQKDASGGDVCGTRAEGVKNNAGVFGLDMGVKFNSTYPVYRFYFTKWNEPEVGDGEGRYWITQFNYINLEATNLQQASIESIGGRTENYEYNSSNIKVELVPVYIWEDYRVSLDFKPNAEVEITIQPEDISFTQDPETLIYTINYYSDTMNEASRDIYNWEEYVRRDLSITALASIPGENCFSLYLADGTWIKDFIPHKYDTDNTTILEWKAQGTAEQPLKIGSSNQYIIVWNNEETPKEILPFDKAEVGETKASGAGVGSDVDAYLTYLRTPSEYVLSSTEEHEVTIYCTPVEDKVRLWINVDDAIKCAISASIGVKPEGANVTTTITPVKDVWYDEDNLTYHSYNRHTPECKITVSGGYGISEATSSGNTVNVVNHQHVDFIGSSVYYATESHIASIVVDVFKQTDYKNIVLYDGNTSDTTMLYPKTSITQVVDAIGDNLETILNRLVERIAALEQALNNN